MGLCSCLTGCSGGVREQWETLGNNKEVTKVLSLLGNLPQGWHASQFEVKRDVMILLISSKLPPLPAKKPGDIV